MIPPLLLAALLAAAPAGPSAAAPGSSRSCILVGSGSDTQYFPTDDHTIAVRSGRRWYRLTVSPTPMLTEPMSFLVNQIRGSSSLCSPVDFELSVATQGGGGSGFRQGLIVQSFEEITAVEGEALRKRARR